MQTYGNSNVEYTWWTGNARFSYLSGRFLAAHIGQIALMAFWAGALTLFELSRYNGDVALGEQGLILMPQMARLGWGVGSGGAIVDTYSYFVIAVIHLAGSAVYGAGALYHAIKGPEDLSEAEVERAAKFHFEWDNPEKSGFILGHHLLFIGVAALLFVAWASTNGIYDPVVGEVRTVSPNANPLTIFKYGWAARGYNPYLVDNLEDVMGGHVFIGALEILGGVFHIAVKPFDWATRIYDQSGEGLLSYALAGLSLMAFNACYFCAVNEVTYPVELFGPILEAKLSVTPYLADTISLPDGGHTARFWLSNFHFFLGFMALQGHLWHALRSSGFDFRRIPDALSSVSS